VKITFFLFLLAAGLEPAAAQKFYTYVGNLSSDSALIAWGTTDGVNTIGRSSTSHGEATVRINGREFTSRQNWAVVTGLTPDAEYPYQIFLDGKAIGRGSFRTWPEKSTRLVFFVIGDFGTGNRAQRAVARAMWNEFQERNASGNPVRFVLTVGDNIYGDLAGQRHTGASDSDWTDKFFEPYAQLLAHIPFYPALGNHDGNETESRGDLAAYLDNFFFPSNKPARYYSFKYADLAEFFGLDSTTNSESGPARPAFLESGQQFQWMRQAVPASTLPWKIPYYHHPMFNAGPRHNPSYRDLSPWLRLFQNAGVKVVFNGHEHNFQMSQMNERSGGIRFVTSGAGGELRMGAVQSRMSQQNIAGWAAQNHFLVVEIEGKTMRITPVGTDAIIVRDPSGGVVPLPVTVTIP
jgi:tartrate-resistant acid phosphatase type 5